MNFLKELAPYRKAIVAFVVAMLQFLALYFQLSENGITAEDKVALINSIIISLGGVGAVYAVANKPKFDK